MEELEKKIKKYAEIFGDGFPMDPLGWGRKPEQIIEIIDECIKNSKNVYEMGYVREDNIY